MCPVEKVEAERALFDRLAKCGSLKEKGKNITIIPARQADQMSGPR